MAIHPGRNLHTEGFALLSNLAEGKRSAVAAQLLVN